MNFICKRATSYNILPVLSFAQVRWSFLIISFFFPGSWTFLIISFFFPGSWTFLIISYKFLLSLDQANLTFLTMYI